ncbi:hypothetical protein D915_006782 [Fasciola hepatica]|uniref:Uncharacterized protein n=1 Tax=Fasciola hepatica TaxID=6192 RepID=A0A4E0R2H8_FASHE|nr:hypothetical protein D915_006782 [Fasciola hepatica]
MHLVIPQLGNIMLIISLTLVIVSFTIVTVDGTGTTKISGEVDILKFEMNSINPPSNMSLGVNSNSLRNAVKNPQGSSICQVVSVYFATRLFPNDLLQVTYSIREMNYRLADYYLGCEPDLQKRWNGTYHLYFFAVNISRTMSNECKQREIAELNEALHKFLEIGDVALFSFMNVAGVSIERNISLWFTTYNYRQSRTPDGCVPEYFIEWFNTRHEVRNSLIFSSENLVITYFFDKNHQKHIPRQTHLSLFFTKNQLHTCFHNVPKEIRKKIRFITYPLGCPPSTFIKAVLLSPNDVTTNEMDYIGENIFKCQTKLVRGTREYEWSKYHGNIVSCESGDSAGEVDSNTEIITVNTKSLTMTVEGICNK